MTTHKIIIHISIITIAFFNFKHISSNSTSPKNEKVSAPARRITKKPQAVSNQVATNAKNVTPTRRTNAQILSILNSTTNKTKNNVPTRRTNQLSTSISAPDKSPLPTTPIQQATKNATQKAVAAMVAKNSITLPRATSKSKQKITNEKPIVPAVITAVEEFTQITPQVLATNSSILNTDQSTKTAQTAPNSAIGPVGSNQNIDPQALSMIEQFFSFFPDPTLPGNQLLPSLKKNINKLYIETLHLPTALIDSIERLYCFLQQQVFDSTLKNQQQIIHGLQSQIEIAQTKKDPLLSTLNQQLEQAKITYTTQQNALNSSIGELCITSDFWQNYLESLIAASFEYELSLLNIVHEQEKEIFPLLPQFEVSYYTKDFTLLRINSEMTHLFLILTENIRNRALEKTTEWKDIQDTTSLYDVVHAFQQSSVYLFQQAFMEATFSTQTYPFPSDMQFLTPSQTVPPELQDFFHVQNINGKNVLAVNQNMQAMIQINQTTGIPTLTSLGNLLFKIKPSTQSTPSSIQHSDAFYSLFSASPTGGFVPTPLYATLIGLSGIKMLNNTLNYLFNTANLESTMAQLATLDSKFFQQFPSIITYEPPDYPYLDMINYLQTGAQSIPSTSPSSDQSQGTAVPQNAVKDAFVDAGNAIAKVAVKAGNEIKNVSKIAGKAIADVAVDLKDAMKESTFNKAVAGFFVHGAMSLKEIGLTIGDAATAFVYYDMGIACLEEDISYSEAQRRANQVLSNSLRHLNNFFDEIVYAVEDLGTVAKELGGSYARSYGATLGDITQNKQIGKDFTNVMTETLNFVIDTAIAAGQIIVTGAGLIVEIAASALLFAVQISLQSTYFTYASIATGGNAGSPFGDLDVLGSSFLSNIVSALIRPLKFVGRALLSMLTDFMHAVAYMATFILDVTIEIGGAAAALAAGIYGDNMSSAFDHVRNTVNEHRGAIVSGIAIGIMIAVSIALTVATAGVAGIYLSSVMGLFFWGITGLMAGMMAMSTVGASQHDTQDLLNKSLQEDLIHSFSGYMVSGAAAMKATQQCFVDDYSAQINDVIYNQERGLVYYQNYLNNTINASITSSAYGLGSFYNQLLTPDPITGVSYGDAGWMYGIQTNRLGLNPSQGLLTYNSQRNSFAQEIAQMPEQIVTDKQKNSVNINQSQSKFWINQKDISQLPPRAPLSAEIRWRTLYETQGAFYIGIFLTNQYIDQAAINGLYQSFNAAQSLTGPEAQAFLKKIWEIMDTVNLHLLNFNSKAKAFVVYRNTINDAPRLGLYEHLGANWNSTDINKRGWIATDIAPIQYQTGVWYRMKMQINNKIAGVKCWVDGTTEPNNWSGPYPVTMDPQFIYPTGISLPTPGVNNTPSSSQSSTTNSGPLKVTTITAAGPKSLDPVTSQWTQIKPASASIISSASIPTGTMGVITSGAAVEYQVINPIAHPIILPQRQKSNAEIDTSFADQNIPKLEIDREKQTPEQLQAAQQIQTGPISFGGFTLTPVSTSLLAQGIYLYSTTQGTGLIGTDYVVFAASITKNSSGPAIANELGTTPDKNPQAIVSIITGKAFDQRLNLIQQCAGVFASFEAAYTLPPTIAQTLSDAINRYITGLKTTITFNNITLTSEATALQNGVFIYSGNSITQNLTGKDYFVAATLGSSGAVTPSSAYGQKWDVQDKTINGMVSLVTGQVFNFAARGKQITTLTGQALSTMQLSPVAKAPLYKNMITAFAGILPAQLDQEIQQQTTAYQTAVIENETQQTTPPSVAEVIPQKPSTIDFSSLISTFGESGGGVGLPSTTIPTTDNPNNSYVIGLGGL